MFRAFLPLTSGRHSKSFSFIPRFSSSFKVKATSYVIQILITFKFLDFVKSIEIELHANVFLLFACVFYSQLLLFGRVRVSIKCT